RRAVGLTHRELLSTARSAISAATATSQDCVLSLAPFSNVTGLTLGLSAPLLSGARVVTTPRSDPRRAIEAIGAHGITVIVAAAETYRALLATVEAEGAATLGGGLRLCVCA